MTNVGPKRLAARDAAAGNPVLELRGISAGYGRTTVLRDVSIDLGHGVVDALIGPNGAGKTTLLRTAAGVMRPFAGTIWIDGVDVTRRPPHDRAKAGICLIPEGRGVWRNLSVKENLLLQVPPWARESSCDRALAAFPILRDRLGQVAGTLSGGEQQMLAVARCYLASPSVVLLDEVSMGLAPRVVDEIFETLMQLASEGISILLVEQYVNRALEMADTVHVINQGQITRAGPASDLDEDTVLRGYLGAELHTRLQH